MAPGGVIVIVICDTSQSESCKRDLKIVKSQEMKPAGLYSKYLFLLSLCNRYHTPARLQVFLQALSTSTSWCSGQRFPMNNIASRPVLNELNEI